MNKEHYACLVEAYFPEIRGSDVIPNQITYMGILRVYKMVLCIGNWVSLVYCKSYEAPCSYFSTD